MSSDGARAKLGNHSTVTEDPKAGGQRRNVRQFLLSVHRDLEPDVRGQWLQAYF